MKQQQIVIIHGGDSFDTRRSYLRSLRKWPVTIESFLPKNGWKGRLQKDLGIKFKVLQPRMPNSNNASYEDWTIWFERMFPFLHQNVILVGHSLGAAFLIKYLTDYNFTKKIKALILVAAPHNHGEVGDFKIPRSLRRMEKQVKQIYFFHSPDDPIVPFSELKIYSKALPNSTAIILNKRRHFNQVKFLELVKLLKGMLR
jgi:uncharacterized protein